ncbi:hypothetical protein BLNAU_1291 [Blattamonas nauphoetae]|uniref:Uncharacterized protein n=1 Tax=Blattamonas nauphoetae TaxID=2049346 RepID=A0ABQ9YJA4_9EUKA|nr:hypothetical protein BLNAU_1291 [Blattamonas nauphoetae]
MGNSSNSEQHRHLRPFNRDRRQTQIIFQRRNGPRYANIGSLEHIAQPFMSLVDYIREGNNLDNQATEDACSLMNQLIDLCRSSDTNDLILFELVPSPDGPCSGFTESLLPLLTSSNMRLVETTLMLLAFAIHSSSTETRFLIIETGLFQRLPNTFYERDMHLLDPSALHLMDRIISQQMLFWVKHKRNRLQ